MKKKYIKVSGEKELRRFYKKLWIYKSLLYHNVTFVSDNVDIKKIIIALNIKNRKKRIDYIYDTVCKEIDEKFIGKNICGFKDGRCHAQNYTGCKHINGCCRKCIYQSSKGCISSNLACKLFFCSEVTSRYEVPKVEDFKILKLLSWQNRTIVKHDFFSKREEVLKDLYFNSIFIAVMRMVYRYIFKNIRWS